MDWGDLWWREKRDWDDWWREVERERDWVSTFLGLQ